MTIFNRTYASSPERREHMAMTLATMSDAALGKTVVETIEDMLRDSPIDQVIACAEVMVGDIRASERLRMKGAS